MNGRVRRNTQKLRPSDDAAPRAPATPPAPAAPPRRSWARATIGLIALALTVGACSVLAGVVAQVLDYRAAEFDVAIERGVAVVTSDGVRLRSDVFLPKGAARIPTILVRVPLDKTTTNTAFATTVGRLWAERGYAVVLQGARGRRSRGRGRAGVQRMGGSSRARRVLGRRRRRVAAGAPAGAGPPDGGLVRSLPAHAARGFRADPRRRAATRRRSVATDRRPVGACRDGDAARSRHAPQLPAGEPRAEPAVVRSPPAPVGAARRQRPGGHALRDGRQRLARRGGVAAGPRPRHAVLPSQRRARQRRRRRRRAGAGAGDLGRAARPLPLRSA